MKELIDFLCKETPSDAIEFLPNLNSLCNHIDNTQSMLEKKMVKIDKKIGFFTVQSTKAENIDKEKV